MDTVTSDDILSDIVKAVKALTEEEQKILRARLNAQLLLKKTTDFGKKPTKRVSLAQIDKWKHESRNYASK